MLARSRTLTNWKLHCLKYVCAMLFVAISVPQDVHGQGQSETVASSGDNAPDGNGTFGSFSGLLLNDSGVISFVATLSGTSGGSLDNQGLYLVTSGGTLTQIAREDQAAPDGNGNISSIALQGLNGSSDVLFTSSFRNTTAGTTDDSGIFQSSGGGIVTVAREGDSAPGGNGEIGAVSTSLNRMGFNNNGTVSFRNVLTNTSGGNLDNDVIFKGTGSLTEVVRDGDTDPDGGTFTSFGTDTKINDSGAVSFVGTSGTQTGVYRADPNGSIVPIYVEGQSAPDFNGSLAFATGFTAINNSGQVAFEGVMTGTANGSNDAEGIFRGDGSNVTQIAREGNSAGGNGVFANMFSTTVRINQSGQVTFSSTLRDTVGGITDNSAIFRSSSSGFSLTEIAREGDAISTGDGSLGALGFAVIAQNDQGHVAFQASISGTLNNSGIFIGDGEELITVAQEGQSLNGSAILQLSFRGGVRHQSGLNRHGQIVYEARLTDGTRTIEKWTPDVHWRRGFGGSWTSSGNWTLGIAPDSIYDTLIDPDSALTVNGNVNATVRSLQVGGGSGIATLNLLNGSVITPTNGMTIESTGVLTGNGTIDGNISSNGTIRASNVVVSGAVTNNGIIRGNGRLHSNNDKTALGEIRVASNESLQLSSGGLNNSGRIEVIGGEIEVAANVQNNTSTGLIAGRDATMRFNGGVENQGAMAFSFGITDFFGDINNNNGNISIGGGAEVTFYDDIVQNGVFEVAAAGSRISSAVILGDFSGAGGFTGGGDVFLLGDLRPGNSPASVLMDGSLFLGGSTTSLIELQGLGLGEFDQLVVTGDLSLAGLLTVDLINGFGLGLNQEFLIADVNGSLFGEFDGLGEGDLVGNYGGLDLYISYTAGDGNDVSLFTSVPEPSSMAFCMVAALGLSCRRRQQRQVS